MAELANRLLIMIDGLAAPIVLFSAQVFWVVRRLGLHRLPVTRRILRMVGVAPITRHYHDPWTGPEIRHAPLDRVRKLPGLDLNIDEQLALLNRFAWREELSAFPMEGPVGSFHYRNGAFGPGDAEFFYSLIRLMRPHLLIEIGGGNSTLIAAAAMERNRAEDQDRPHRHVCVEPFENPWLNSSGVEVERTPVEQFDRSVFAQLQRGDMLFIDSSHVIRSQGDVLTLYQEIVPALAPGVLVHAHDIFTPRDYPARWLDGAMLLWNEQYLLESFLTGNRDFRVIGALNHLYHDHYAALAGACPVLAAEGGPEPGSFWFVRN